MRRTALALSHAAWLALFVLGALPGAAAPPAEGAWLTGGTWPIRSGFLLSNGFLDPGPIGAATLKPGRWGIDIVFSLSNTLVQSDFLEFELDELTTRFPADLAFLRQAAAGEPSGFSYHLDGEAIRSAVHLRRGFAGGFEVEVALPMLHIGGGVLDGPIEAFHDLLGADQDGRQALLTNATTFFFQTPQSEQFGSLSSGPALGNIELGVRRALGRRGRWQRALGLGVKLPTSEGGPLSGSKSLDVGLQLSFSRTLGRGQLHLSPGLLHLGKWPELDLDAQWIGTIGVAYERPLGRGLSMLGQLTATQSPFADLPYTRLAEPHTYYGTLGLNLRIPHVGSVLFAVTENLVHFDNSADLGVHLGWRVKH